MNKSASEKEIREFAKKASDRFARLGLIKKILTGSGRERYDHFLANGFPKWRGTGYYYARFRPGLGSVLFGLFVLCGGPAHYAVLILGWKRQRDFVERYIKHARRTAWGDDMGIGAIPGIDGGASVPAPPPASTQQEGSMGLNRRQKRMQERENKKGKEAKKTKLPARRSGTSTPLETDSGSSPQGQRKRVQAENGKVLLVDSVGNVFLEEENEDGEKGEYLLDLNEIPKPTFRQTFVFQLPILAYSAMKARLLGEKEDHATEEEELLEEDSDNSSAEEIERVIAMAKSAPNGRPQKRGKANGKGH